MKVHYESKLLDWFPRGTIALTVGEHVFVANAIATQRTLLHEAGHVLQYRKLGVLRFVVLYAWYSLRYGYEMNPLEIQATAFADYRLEFFSSLENSRYLSTL